MEDVLDFRELRMRYGKTALLNGVSFTARRGEVLIPLRLRPPHGGEAGRARTGVVLQSWRDHAKWQVRELLAHLGRYYAPYSTPSLTRPWDADDLLETVGLPPHDRKRGRDPARARRPAPARPKAGADPVRRAASPPRRGDRHRRAARAAVPRRADGRL